jgi:hypothetical protein
VIVDAVRFVPTGALNESEMAMGVPEEVREKLADAQARLKDLEAEEQKLKKSAPPAPAMVMAPADADRPVNARINLRGNPHTLGAEAPRGFLSVASTGTKYEVPANQSGRVELARWLTDSRNALTARVYVNRVWAHLFGTGIVRTVDNFGTQGERPSHPELIDEIAACFVEDGWSTKRLVRSLVLTRTYQQSAVRDPQSAMADPENRLFGRANRRRVEAEVIRDAMLAVAGTLDRTPGGCPVTGLGERAIDNDSKGGVPVDAVTKRSVYLPVVRNDVPAMLEVFDFADPDVSVGRRDATTVPTQALFLMNSPFVQEQARHAAKRLLALPADDAGRLSDLYRRAFGREPTAKETETALAFLAKRPPESAWSAVCAAVFGSTEFRFVE